MTILVGTSLLINGGALSVLRATYSQALQQFGNREAAHLSTHTLQEASDTISEQLLRATSGDN